ncbi:MAG: hypothetical protein U0800_05195 [Isosphaeraceae bacterium]
MDANAADAISVKIVIKVLLALLRRFFPPQPDAESEPFFTEEEIRIFNRWELGTIPAFLICIPLLSLAWYFPLTWAAHWVQQRAPGDRFLLVPSPFYWALPSLFLGIISSSVAVAMLLRALLRDRYRRFVRYGNVRAGIDGWAAFRWLAAIVIGGSILGILVGLTSYARFDEEGVEIGRPLRFQGQFYPYRSIQSIEHRATLIAPNGNTVRRPHHVLLFEDGTTWSTREGARDPIPDLDVPMSEFIAKQAGRTIVELP